jgi:hypothetical protein
MTLTKILCRTAANVSRLALKVAGIALVAFVLCPAAAHSQGGIPLWTNRYNGPGNGDDHANAVAVDSSNNVIVTGQSYNGTNLDYATIKYSSAGIPLWTNRYDGPEHYDDNASAVAVDSSNNVIVTGSPYFSYGVGRYYGYVTIKYSNAGVPLWTNLYNGPGNGGGIAYAMAVDHSNNVIVTGSSYNGTNNDYATIKYSSIMLSPIPLNFQTTGNQMGNLRRFTRIRQRPRK